MLSIYSRLVLLPLLLVATLGARAEDAVDAAPEPAPDTINLTNGSQILGSITTVRDGVVTIETDFAGTLEIAVDKIASLQTADPVVVQLADDSVIEGQPLVIKEEQIVLDDTSARSIDELLTVNPEPWELGYGYNWTGLVSLAFAVERGNTKTDELDYNIHSNWRSDDDRYTLKSFGELDKANDVKNADNWTIVGKYDYFLDGPNYWGMNAFAQSDEFVDLDLRYYVGPYVGREFYTAPVFSLQAEAGVAYVNEDFIEAPDQEYPGGSWTINMSSNYLGGDSRLYFDQLGILNLNRPSDAVINTTFGLAFPLLFGLEVAAEVRLEYDSGAVEGVDKLDEAYSLRLGYSW